METVQVFLVDLGPARGLTVKNSDDSYTILINNGLSHEAQCAVYDHEVSHIDNKDYDHIYDVSVLERLRHYMGA